MNRLKTLQAQRMAIQAKLNIGEPNDKYEREADHTAVQVVQQINSSSQNQQSVQRDESMESEQKEEEELQMKPDISQIQRHESMEDESEDLQMKSLVQGKDNVGGGEVSSDLESSIEGARGGGQSLDSSLQEKMGVAMGADFSGVKVHTDSQSDQLNRSIQAKAFTTGQDLFFRQGAYEPSSRGGQELIAHELTHVVQQNGGAVMRSPVTHTLQAKGDTTDGHPGTAPRQRPNTTGLPDTLKTGMESLSGISMDTVKVHYNSSQPAQLNALAYAQGSNIHVAPGQEQHLPHEAWHVIQQAQGRVKPTIELNGDVPVNDDTGLEHEADVMGAKALGHHGQLQGLPEGHELSHGQSAPVQRTVSKVWGKWKSSYDMKKDFPSEAEATVFDNDKKAEAAAAQEVADAAAADLAETTWAAAAAAAAWKFSDATHRLSTHFTDGWGEAYRITSNSEIKQTIIDGHGSEEIGIQEIYLGSHKNKRTGVVKGCNIQYENEMIAVTAGGITREAIQSNVFHCGPAVGAG